jgi:uncharacterized membrane protein
MSLKKWYAVMVVTAFIGVISFFQINSYFADKHKANGVFIIIGILFSLAAIGSYFMANKIGNPGKDK